MSGPAVEAATVEHVAAPNWPPHLSRALEFVQADGASFWQVDPATELLCQLSKTDNGQALVEQVEGEGAGRGGDGGEIRAVGFVGEGIGSEIGVVKRGGGFEAEEGEEPRGETTEVGEEYKEV